uniref:Uncharacterized protein n=1 Tax=Rhodopseudomonas palustris (strain BisA53) TaxID=316055 RepID=Q07MX4_RHOP5
MKTEACGPIIVSVRRRCKSQSAMFHRCDARSILQRFHRTNAFLLRHCRSICCMISATDLKDRGFEFEIDLLDHHLLEIDTDR